MLTSKSWRRAATAVLVAGLVTVSTYAPAVAEPGGQGTPPPHSAAAGGPPGPSPATPGPAAPAAPAGDEGKQGKQGEQADGKHSGKDHAKAKGHDTPAQGKGESQAQGPQNGKADPPRHTPVTVCHLLGNGGYHLLTMDDSALKAHQAHGDLYPVPAGGCPAASTTSSSTSPSTSTAPETADDTVGEPDEGQTQLEGTTPGDALVLGSGSTVAGTTPVVAGVEQTTSSTRPAAAVLGVQQVAPVAATGAAAAPAAAPVAGVLPQTGAGRIGMLLAGAGALIAAGLTVLRRRQAGATG